MDAGRRWVPWVCVLVLAGCCSGPRQEAAPAGRSSSPGQAQTVAAVAAAVVTPSVAAEPSVAALASELVWAKPADGKRILEALLARGALALREVTAGVRAPGQGEDAGVRSALHGLALAVGDGTREAERAMLAGVLLEALEGPADPEVLSFFVAQLQIVGRDEAVPALAARLGDARLGDPAVRALCQIGTPAARAALRQALADAGAVIL